MSHESDTGSLDANARSWYGTSFSFSRRYSIPYHYFDGNNVGIEMDCSSKGSGSFSVSLYRNGLLIGTAEFNRNGFTKAVWTNVGPGNYSFELVKTDSASVKCSNVAMYSW